MSYVLVYNQHGLVFLFVCSNMSEIEMPLIVSFPAPSKDMVKSLMYVKWIKF